MAANLMACMKSLAEVDPSVDKDLQALNLGTAWRTNVIAQPIHTPFLARWLTSKTDLLKTEKDSFKAAAVQPAMTQIFAAYQIQDDDARRTC